MKSEIVYPKRSLAESKTCNGFLCKQKNYNDRALVNSSEKICFECYKYCVIHNTEEGLPDPPKRNDFNPKDLIGTKSRKLFILEVIDSKFCKVRCDCGSAAFPAAIQSLRKKALASCGCLEWDDKIGRPNKKGNILLSYQREIINGDSKIIGEYLCRACSRKFKRCTGDHASISSCGCLKHNKKN